MIERLSAVDPNSAADAITKEYIEVTVAVAIEDLKGPGSGDFFGRIDQDDDKWYVGRRHIEDDAHDPVVVDWRAPIAAPFYRATAIDPLGIDFRRRFTLNDGDLIAYLDEQLDDPESGDVAGGIPDPVLAEIGAERSGEMREIVATIQGEQDVVIRSDIDQVLIVQGGPGTGKTAVALHRAAYLLFEHRARLARDGVLVVGPNKAFLDYIGNVLPSLGERRVRQATVDELCIPRVEITGIDESDLARWKGSAERLSELEAAALAAIVPPDDDLVVPIGARNHMFTSDEIAGWLQVAKGGISPINERRVRVTALAKRELLRRTGDDGAWSKAGPLKTAIDEANSLLNGSPFTYGHVVVDEAQDHSAVALRVIGRRSPSSSMTLVGDVAQSTTPAGQERWSEVFGHLGPAGSNGIVVDLTIGYRVPEPILRIANRLLPLTGVDATESRSVRIAGEPPSWVRCPSDQLAATVAASTATMKSRHKLTGIVAPAALHESIIAALSEHNLVGTDHVHNLERAEVPVFTAEAVKGLEFDGVIVVNPHEILHENGDEPTPRGARLLYVAITRAVQQVEFVTDAAPPAVIAPDRSA